MFSIDRYDPLYDPLNTLLPDGGCITIFDEENKKGLKQVEIKKCDDKNEIYVLFSNNMRENGYNGAHKWSINVSLTRTDEQKEKLIEFTKNVYSKYLEMDKQEEKPKVLAYPSIHVSGVM